MLTEAHSSILEDLSRNHDVTARLCKAFDPVTRSTSRSQRLELTQAVLADTREYRSEASHSAFLEAIISLRNLVPFLKAKDSLLIETIAVVEKYAVNYALSFCAIREAKSAKFLASIATLLDESLRRLFDARSSLPKRSRPPRQCRKRGDNSSDMKENEDPQLPDNAPSSLPCSGLETLFFKGATKRDNVSLLPRKDSANVSVVVAGALAAKLGGGAVKIAAPQLLRLVKSFVVPWLKYLQSSGDGPESNLHRQGTVFFRYVQDAMLVAAESDQGDARSVLRVRAYALSLGEVRLKQYAHDLLRAVHCLSRGRPASSQRSTNDVNDFIASTYDDALGFVSSYGCDDPDWLSEDVSAWMDHVAVVWSFRSESLPVPSPFERRVAMLRERDHETLFTQACELQIGLMRLNAYNPECMVAHEEGVAIFAKSMPESMEQLLSKLDVPSLKCYSDISPTFCDNIAAAQCPTVRTDGLHKLRLLRTLEPLRKTIVECFADCSNMPFGGELLLRVYVSALLGGLLEFRRRHPLGKCPGGCCKDVLMRLNKMVGAAVEALNVLLFLYTSRQDAELVISAVKCAEMLLVVHSEISSESAKGWRFWISQALLSRLQNMFNSLQSSSDPDRFRVFELIEHWAESSSNLWYSSHDEDPALCKQHGSFLKLARESSLVVGLWKKAAEMSLKSLSLLVRRSKTGSLPRDKKAVYGACHTFARDYAYLAELGIPQTFVLSSSFSPDFLLAVLVEFSCWAKLNWSFSKLHQGRSDVLHGLQRSRAVILTSMKQDQEQAMCWQRRLHYIWTTFISKDCERMSDTEKRDLLYLVEADVEGCSGHSTAGMFGNQTVDSLCSSAHVSFVREIATTCICLADGDYAGTQTALESALGLMSSNHDLSCDIELLQLAAEICKWVGSVLAVSDFDSNALLALEVAEECESKLGIPSKDTFVLDLCQRLSNNQIHARFLKSRCVSSELDGYQAKMLNTMERFEDALSLTDGKTGRIFKEARADALELGRGDVLSALDDAIACLKLSLKELIQASERGHPFIPPSPFVVAGVKIDISFDHRLESGQAKLGQLLCLIANLRRVARLHLLTENFAEGQYYLQQCLHIAAHCLPSESYVLGSLSAASHGQTFLQTGMLGETNDSMSTVGDQIVNQTESGRNAFSKAEAAHGVAAAMLSGNSRQRVTQEQAPCGIRIISLYEHGLHALEYLKQGESYTDGLLVACKRLNVRKGAAHALVSENSVAKSTLKLLVTDQTIRRRDLLAMSLFFFAWSLIADVGGPYAILNSIASKPSSCETPANVRTTRSRTRKLASKKTAPSLSGVIDEIKKVLQQACSIVAGKFQDPQLARRIRRLDSLLASDADRDVYRLSTVVGDSFNLRWMSSMHSRAMRSVKEGSRGYNVRQLADSFNDMKLSSPDEFHLGKQELATRLRRAGIVVVGLSVDESKGFLLVWRISGDGTWSSRVELPKAGPTSYYGIMCRLSEVLSTMHNSSIKPGQIMTDIEKEEWWEERYKLDDDMRQILSDVESDWLGALRMALIPSTSRCNFISKTSCRSESLNSIVGRSAAAFPEIAQVGASNACELDADENCIADDVNVVDLVLILDTVLEKLPWESIPVLRGSCTSVTRAPSLEFLNYHLGNVSNSANSKSLFYVVNPAGDLLKTEKKFQKLLGAQDGWNGSFGDVTGEDVSSRYNGEQIFLFCGHGAGEAFFSPRKFSKRDQPPIAILMGCSSACPKKNFGDHESNGTVADYLINGSPAVVGNLWDVSDGDIDRFTSSLLFEWLGVAYPEEKAGVQRQNLAQAVATARSACRFPYLVGAASIVVGAPNIQGHG